MRPSLSVDQAVPSMRRSSPRRSPRRRSRWSHRAGSGEPLESHRDLDELPAELRDDTVDDRARDDRLPDGRGGGPAWPVRDEVVDGDRQVVVRVEEARRGRHDPVAVRVGIAAEGDPVTVLEADEPAMA